MQLGQAETVGVLDDEGVDVGNVHARLDDGGAHEHVHLAVGHALHDGRELLLVHFPVRRGHAHLAAEHLAQAQGGALDVVDAIVQVIHLSAAGKLAPDGVAHRLPVVLHHKGLHRLPQAGRLLDDRHVPDAGQRHIQRARDGRCR